MILNISNSTYVIFDLDDTLYAEYDFLCSGFKAIDDFLFKYTQKIIFEEMLTLWEMNIDVFGTIIEKYHIPIDKIELINIYRLHKPKIELFGGVAKMLKQLSFFNIPLGIITDGRSTTQRNKIEALGIKSFFHRIVISEEVGEEKPSLNNYLHFEKDSKQSTYIYIGDNFSKDFVSPNKLKWITIGITGGVNRIHKKIYDLEERYYPKYEIESISHLIFNIS